MFGQKSVRSADMGRSLRPPASPGAARGFASRPAVKSADTGAANVIRMAARRKAAQGL